MSEGSFFKTKDELAMETKAGNIPPAENVLQRAIRFAQNNSRTVAEAAPLTPFGQFGSGTNVPASDIPKVVFQTGQGVVADLPQNIVENPESFATGGVPGVQFRAGQAVPGQVLNSFFGGNAPDAREVTPFSGVGQAMAEGFLEPQSPQGKVAGITGNILSGFIPIAAPQALPKAASAAGRGAEKVLSPINPTPAIMEQIDLPNVMRGKLKAVKKGAEPTIGRFEKSIAETESQLSGIKQQSGLSQKINTQARRAKQKSIAQELARDVNDLKFEAKRGIPEKIDAKRSQANDLYGDRLKEINLKVEKDDLMGLIDDTLSDKSIKAGERIQLTPSEQKLVKIAEDLDSTEVDVGDVKDLKGLIARVRKEIPANDHALTVFYQKVGDFLEGTSEGRALKELNQGHKKIYELSKKAKEFTPSAVAKKAKGAMGPEETKFLEEIESELGTDVLKKASQIREKSVRLAKELEIDPEVMGKFNRKEQEQLENLLLGKKELLKKFKAKVAENLENIRTNTSLRRAELRKEVFTKTKRAVMLAALGGLLAGRSKGSSVRDVIARM